MKKLLITGALVLSAAVVSGTALAQGHVKLIVNNRVVDAGADLQDGKTTGWIRPVAEALGAKVRWDSSSKTVFIDYPDVGRMNTRITLLEQALAPQTPLEAVNRFAEGVKTRNGAMQFAVLSPQLKDEKKNFYESFNWVTGTSSPWVEKYSIAEQGAPSDGSHSYKITYTFTDSTRASLNTEEVVKVSKFVDKWLISDLPNMTAK